MRYPGLFFMLVSLALGFLLFAYPLTHELLRKLADFGYLGALLGGALFVWSYSVGIGLAILLTLKEELPLVPLAIAGGIGGMLGDLVIFRFVKSTLKRELLDIAHKLWGKKAVKNVRKGPLKFFLPVIGVIIVLSPFPDELGISLMGLSRISTIQFILLTATLDSINVYLMLSLLSL